MLFDNFVVPIADGVYSDHYTSNQEAGGLESVVQVPFFKLVKRLNDQRFAFQILESLFIHFSKEFLKGCLHY